MEKSSSNILKKCLFIAAFIITIALVIFDMVRYSEEGEKELPFYINKILLISTVDGQDVENSTQKWEKIINQNNDIYLYVEKNNEYKKTETISSIILNNFKTEKNNNIGQKKIII